MVARHLLRVGWGRKRGVMAVDQRDWKKLLRDAVVVASVTVSGTVLALTAVVFVVDKYWPCLGVPKTALLRSITGSAGSSAPAHGSTGNCRH